MEDAAIREGFADLRPGGDYDPLYQSALCRQKADWLIGINASRLFSVLYHRTLAMLADQDSKIILVRKEKYHHVRLALEGAEAVSDRIVSPENAQAIRDACSEFFPDVAARVNDKEVSDHHAILPTLELEKADVPGLPVGERNILLLVCCKLLCAAEPFVYETVTAAFDCGGHTFTAKGKQVLSQGWPSRRYSVPP